MADARTPSAGGSLLATRRPAHSPRRSAPAVCRVCRVFPGFRPGVL